MSRRPAGQEAQLLLRRAIGWRGLSDPYQVFAGQLKSVAGEREVTNDRVMEAFDGGPVEADVVTRPPCPEGVTASRNHALVDGEALPVRGQDVKAAVTQVRRRGKGIEDPVDTRPH
jgi:hypothetical protein